MTEPRKLLRIGEGAESTSALLRRAEDERDEAVAKAERVRGFWQECSRHRDEIQSALAASQADLTRVQKERDEALADRDAVSLIADRLRAELTEMQKPCAWRGLAEDLMRERTGLIYVARGPSGTCVLCGGDIIRGHAVESVAGQTKPQFAHAVCPTKEKPMQKPITARKKPVEITAIQWTGDNASAVDKFAEGHFDVLDDEDRGNCDDPEATAQIRDRLHQTWVLTYTGDWIIRGVQGEFYPCRDSVFRDTYDVL